MVAVLLYFLLSLAVAILGINRKFGFWGYFFASLLMSPVVGLILMLGSDPRHKRT